MVQTAQSLEFTIVHTEIEALTLEYSWIKEFEPRFNVIFRSDDKSYPYLKITNEEFPCAQITREKHRRNAKYYGPYPKTWAIRTTFGSLQELYKVRNCTNAVFNNSKRQGRPCLLGYINKCSAPCVGRISVGDYAKSIQSVKEFLKGDIRTTSSLLKQQMEVASKSMQFEMAAKLRDQLEAIEIVAEKNNTELSRNANIDVIGAWGDDLELGVHIFFIRKGFIIGEKVWVLERGVDEDDGLSMQNIILDTYLNTDDIPPEIAVCTLPSSLDTLVQLLEGVRKAKVNLHQGMRGRTRDLVEKAVNNAKQTLESARKRRSSDLTSRNQAIDEIRVALNLKRPPLRIECFDISHLQGEHQTGAMVVFEDGLAKKKYYRLYNLRGSFIKWSKDGVPDDTAAVYEVIRRRLEHSESSGDDTENESSKDASDEPSKRFAYAPDLLLIDGGKPQVNAAYRALKDLGKENDIALAGIAKRLEEIWLPGESTPVIMPRHSLGLYLLQQLRDESHRFSVVSMRKRYAKKIKTSKLDNVPGLGPQKQKALLKAFKSLKKMQQAPLEDLTRVKGITEEIAVAIKGL
jgi:excinuclease ABC subunit C